MGNTVMPLQFQCLELQRCKCKQDKYVHSKAAHHARHKQRF